MGSGLMYSHCADVSYGKDGMVKTLNLIKIKVQLILHLPCIGELQLWVEETEWQTTKPFRDYFSQVMDPADMAFVIINILTGGMIFSGLGIDSRRQYNQDTQYQRFGLEEIIWTVFFLNEYSWNASRSRGFSFNITAKIAG